MNSNRHSRWIMPLAVVAVLVTAGAAQAQGKKISGHFGFVLPLAADVDGETVTIDDDFVIGFPTGIGIGITDKITFDLEFVPIINDTPEQSVELVIHPGAIFSLQNGFAAGVRFALEVEGDAWGFTPLVARGFPIEGTNVNYFVELDFPIRFFDDALGDKTESVGIAFHSGISF